MKKIIFAISAIVFLASCQTELDISKVAQKRRLVVNALLNDQDKLAVWVSQSTNISDSVKPGALANAMVDVKDELGNITVCTFNGFTEFYESNLVLASGKTYAITVKASGFPDAYATVRIPDKAGQKKSEWKDSTSMDSSGFPIGTITVHIDDNFAAKNYYRITLYYYDDVVAEWRAFKPTTTDAELERSAIRTEDGGIIFSDQIFNGTKRAIGFIAPFGFANQSPKFLIVTENLSNDYYTYFKSLDDYRNSGGLFSEPRAVYTNITNGLGIAAGSSIQRDTIQ